MAQITEADILKRSVKNDEVKAIADGSGGGLYRFWINPLDGAPLVSSMSADPPAYWSSARDADLKRVYRLGGLWASAISISTTRVIAAGYEVGDDVSLRVRRARELIGDRWHLHTTRRSNLAGHTR